MQKKAVKKLTLHRESLRLLTLDALSQAGAKAADPFTEVLCPSAPTGVCDEAGNR